MTYLLIAAALLLFLAVGLVINTWVRPVAKDETAGVKLELLVSPLLSLTVVLLSFVLVQVFISFKTAKDAAALEATRVSYEYDLAGYYPTAIAQQFRAQVTCYVRSVAYLEWPELGGGDFSAPTTTYWDRGVDRTLMGIPAAVGDGQPYAALLAADKERGDQRRLRLAQARPAVPVEISALLLLVSGIAVLSISTFTLRTVSRRTQVGALLVLTAVLGGVQVAILDLDSHYDGSITMLNTDFVMVEEQLTQRFKADHPGQSLPCAADGAPTDPAAVAAIARQG